MSSLITYSIISFSFSIFFVLIRTQNNYDKLISLLRNPKKLRMNPSYFSLLLGKDSFFERLFKKKLPFREYIGNGRFQAILVDYFQWKKSIHSIGNRFLLALLVFSLTLLFFISLDQNIRPRSLNQIDLILSVINLLFLSYTYFYIVLPFVKNKKIPSKQVFLAFRSQKEYYATNFLSAAFILFLLSYCLIVLFFDAKPFFISSLFLFLHLLSLSSLSRYIVEKGGPFSSEYAYGRSLNQLILHQKHYQIIGSVFYIIYFHLFLMKPQVEMLNTSLIFLVALLLLVQIIRSLVKEGSIQEEFILHVKEYVQGVGK